VRHHPLSHTFRLQDVFKKPLHQHKIQRRARKQMLQFNRPLPKRQGFASAAPPCCRFFAAIASAPQRGM